MVVSLEIFQDGNNSFSWQIFKTILFDDDIGNLVKNLEILASVIKKACECIVCIVCVESWYHVGSHNIPSQWLIKLRSGLFLFQNQDWVTGYCNAIVAGLTVSQSIRMWWGWLFTLCLCVGEDPGWCWHLSPALSCCWGAQKG